MASFKNFCQKNSVNFDEYWNINSDAELVHFIGKDILYFHALFWPATLKYSDFRLPDKIYAHGFLTINGEKMSKSRGTFITARSYLDTLKNPDLLRYYFFSKLNDSMEDIDLNLDDFLVKVNSDLVGKFINIASRTSGFIVKYFDNILIEANDFTDEDSISYINNLVALKKEIISLYDARQYSKLTRLVMSHVEVINEFVNKREPWILAKQDSQQQMNSDLHEVCSTALQAFRLISIYLAPVFPGLVIKIESFFNDNFKSFDQVELSAKTITKYEHLLSRIEQKDIDAMINLNLN